MCECGFYCRALIINKPSPITITQIVLFLQQISKLFNFSYFSLVSFMPASCSVTFVDGVGLLSVPLEVELIFGRHHKSQFYTKSCCYGDLNKKCLNLTKLF